MKINRKEITVVTVCPFCCEEHEIEVNEDDYLNWREGTLLAQEAFPYLSADIREMLISGICSTCWDKMFGSDEELDSEDEDLHLEEDDDEGFYFGEDYDEGFYSKEDFEYEPDLEMGFNPYLGGYDYDC